MKETPAQFTERMREKYSAILKQMENQGLTEDQKYLDELLDKSLKKLEEMPIEKSAENLIKVGTILSVCFPKKQTELIKLSDILRKY